MKKILAVLLALTMVFMLCVPVFAIDTTIDKNTAQKPAGSGKHVGTGTVSVDGNNADNQQFSVTIPADTSLTWGKTTEQYLDYSLTCQLQAEKRLQVTASVESPNALKATDGTTDKIPYSFDTSKATVISNSYNVTSPENHQLGFTIADWSTAPLKEYQDTITFEVQIITPPAP